MGGLRKADVFLERPPAVPPGTTPIQPVAGANRDLDDHNAHPASRRCEPRPRRTQRPSSQSPMRTETSTNTAPIQPVTGANRDLDDHNAHPVSRRCEPRPRRRAPKGQLSPDRRPMAAPASAAKTITLPCPIRTCAGLPTEQTRLMAAVPSAPHDAPSAAPRQAAAAANARR